jgi:hypothetical protein
MRLGWRSGHRGRRGRRQRLGRLQRACTGRTGAKMNKRKEGETSSPRCEASGILIGGGEAEGKEIVSDGDPAEFRLRWRCA